MKNIRDVLKENIKFYRNEAGLTQAQLAEKCGVGTNHIGKMEIASKDPSLIMLEKLSYALDIDVFELFIDRDKIEKSKIDHIDENIKKIMIKLDIDE